MYYYAYINADNIVTGVYALPTPVAIDGYIEITQDQYENGDLVGKVYDPETNSFSSLPDWIGSTDEVKYKSTNVTLSDKLDSIETDIASKANASDLHNHDNKTVLDGITAEKVSLWDNGTAGADGEDGATTIIPKSNATGGNWNGKSFLCDIPRYIGSNVNDVDTERRIMKILYIYDNYIKGSPNNNKDDRNDVVLRAVYEI